MCLMAMATRKWPEALGAWRLQSLSREGQRGAMPHGDKHSVAYCRLGRGAGPGKRRPPCPSPLPQENAYCIGEKAAGIRILFC
jgi:hypothetical protein